MIDFGIIPEYQKEQEELAPNKKAFKKVNTNLKTIGTIKIMFVKRNPDSSSYVKLLTRFLKPTWMTLYTKFINWNMCVVSQYYSMK